jgi:hypothetical protein
MPGLQCRRSFPVLIEPPNSLSDASRVEVIAGLVMTWDTKKSLLEVLSPFTLGF